MAFGKQKAPSRYRLLPKRRRLERVSVLLAKGRFLEAAPNAPSKDMTFYNAFKPQ
jgi:hypothetical protein